MAHWGFCILLAYICVCLSGYCLDDDVRKARQRSGDCSSILKDPQLKNVAKKLEVLKRTSIRITQGEGYGEPAILSSKLGGCPDLPPKFVWPTVEPLVPKPSRAFLRAYPKNDFLPPDGVVPLPFIAQVLLSDARPFDDEGLLPKKGILYFFYNPIRYPSDTGKRVGTVDNMTGIKYDLYGGDSPGKWRVVHYDGDLSRLKRRPFPAAIPAKTRYKCSAITFRKEIVLPCVETAHIGGQGSKEGRVVLTKKEWLRYTSLRYKLRANNFIQQMLGYADQYGCSVSHYSYSRWRSTVFPKLPKFDGLTKAQKQGELEKIRLLLQLDAIDGDGEWFGRNSQLFFFMMEKDLMNLRFDRVWTGTN